MLRHALSEIRENYDWSWWQKQVIRHIVRPYLAKLRPSLTDGIRVMDEEWDNLIVLDACRADLFEEVAPINEFDEYRAVTSLGSATSEWTQKNFARTKFGDTVYVTGNPNTSVNAGDSFHRLIEVWMTDFDEEIGTVHVSPLVKAAKTALENYPDKRLITHFMQPHHPFITRPDVRFDGWSAQRDTDGNTRVNTDVDMNPWKALKHGTVDESTIRDAYRENLETILDDVLKFAYELPGRTVVTSDHGNAFGERVLPIPICIYGHPDNIRLESLVKVPWAVIDGPRRDVVDEGISSQTDATTVEIENRLQALGYTE